MTDLLGGQFDMMCDQTTNTTGADQGRQDQGLCGDHQRKRLAVLPDLPTLEESGLKGFEVTAWHAMWAPKRPAGGRDRSKLAGALQAALKDPKVVGAACRRSAPIPVPQQQATPEALASHLKAEVAKWSPVIKASGAKGT